MKGLLRNDILAVWTSAKMFAVFMVLFGIFCVTVTSPSLQMYFVVIGIVGFSLNAAVVLNEEHASKWGKYKLTLPVKRVDIVKSLFCNYILWMLIGTGFAVVETCLSWLLHGCSFQQYLDIVSVFALGICISLFVGAVFLPLFYTGGEEKNMALLIISLLCAFAITTVLVNVTDASLPLQMVVLLVCSSAAYAFAYPVTIAVFKRKEY